MDSQDEVAQEQVVVEQAVHTAVDDTAVHTAVDTVVKCSNVRCSLDDYLITCTINQPATEEEALEVFYRLHLLIAPWVLEKIPYVKAKTLLCKLFNEVEKPAEAPAAAEPGVIDKVETVADMVTDKVTDIQEKLTAEVKKAASPVLAMISKCWKSSK